MPALATSRFAAITAPRCPSTARVVTDGAEGSFERPHGYLEAVAHQPDLSLHGRIVRPRAGDPAIAAVAALGDTEVHRADDQEGDAGDDLQWGSTTPYGRSASTRSSGTNTSSIVTSLLAVRMPRVSQLSCTLTPGR